MPKDYPFELQTLVDIDGGGTCSYWSKGHHPSKTLIDAVIECDGITYDLQDVSREWRRWHIVAGPDGWARVLDRAKQGSRGAFPVTIIDRL